LIAKELRDSITFRRKGTTKTEKFPLFSHKHHIHKGILDAGEGSYYVLPSETKVKYTTKAEKIEQSKREFQERQLIVKKAMQLFDGLDFLPSKDEAIEQLRREALEAFQKLNKGREVTLQNVIYMIAFHLQNLVTVQRDTAELDETGRLNLIRVYQRMREKKWDLAAYIEAMAREIFGVEAPKLGARRNATIDWMEENIPLIKEFVLAQKREKPKTPEPIKNLLFTPQEELALIRTIERHFKTLMKEGLLRLDDEDVRTILEEFKARSIKLTKEEERILLESALKKLVEICVKDLFTEMYFYTDSSISQLLYERFDYMSNEEVAVFLSVIQKGVKTPVAFPDLGGDSVPHAAPPAAINTQSGERAIRRRQKLEKLIGRTLEELIRMDLNKLSQSGHHVSGDIDEVVVVNMADLTKCFRGLGNLTETTVKQLQAQGVLAAPQGRHGRPGYTMRDVFILQSYVFARTSGGGLRRDYIKYLKSKDFADVYVSVFQIRTKQTA